MTRRITEQVLEGIEDADKADAFVVNVVTEQLDRAHSALVTAQRAASDCGSAGLQRAISHIDGARRELAAWKKHRSFYAHMSRWKHIEPTVAGPEETP